MVDSQLVKTFSADKHRFFAEVNPAADPLRMHKVRNQSRYRFKVIATPPQDVDPEKNTLYLYALPNNVSSYTYKYLNGSGSLIEKKTGANYATILQDTYKKGDNGFYFVAQHRTLIEQEFNDLYAVLQRNGVYPDEFWLYCYSICFDLENYYLDDAYSDPVQAAKYYQLRIRLEHRCEKGVFPNNDNPAVIVKTIGEQLRTAIKDMLDTLQHTSAIRGWIGFVNLYRILFVFSRLAVQQTLIMAQQLKWLENLSHFIGHTLDFNALLAVINAPTGVFNLLSVAVFEVRLCIILGEILKHVFAPTVKEKSRSKLERLKQELFERGLDIYNDLSWSIVNTLCNYGYLAGPIATQLTVAFLLLDALVILCRYGMTQQAYLLKKRQYVDEIEFYLGPCTYTIEHIELQIKLVELQQSQLDIEWGATRAKLLFQAGGALLLMGGFSAALLFTAPAAVATLCFVGCTVAVAMFLSSGQFHGYIQACLIEAEHQRLGHNAIPALSTADARDVFLKAMVKNTVMPLVMVTAFTLYWPGALLLAAGYLFLESCSASTPSIGPLPPTPVAAIEELRDDLVALPPLVF